MEDLVSKFKHNLFNVDNTRQNINNHLVISTMEKKERPCEQRLLGFNISTAHWVPAELDFKMTFEECVKLH